MNYKLSIDASKFIDADIIELPDKETGIMRDCLVIPIEKNCITTYGRKPVIHMYMNEKAYCYGQSHYLTPIFNRKQYAEHKESGIIERVRFMGEATPIKTYKKVNKYNVEERARECIGKLLEEE